MSYSQYQQRPRSGMAIASLILGLIVCLGPLTALPAIILGLVARQRVSNDPTRYGGAGMALGGIIAGTLSLLLTCSGIGGSYYFYKQGIKAFREKDLANAREILQSAITYSNGQPGGNYPPRLAAAYVGDPQHYLYSSTTTPRMTANFGDWRSWADDLDRHSDYVYIGADLNARATADVVVLYGKKTHPLDDGGRIVGYADGRVEWVEDRKLGAILDQSNAARGASGLRPVALDAPPPTAPFRQPVVVNPPNPQNVPPVRQPGIQPQPPEIPRNMAISSGREALTALRTGTPTDRRNAASYLTRSPVDEAVRAEIVREVIKSLTAAPDQRLPNAGELLKKYATKDDASLLRNTLDDLTTDNARTVQAMEGSRAILEILGGIGDEKSIASMVRALHNPIARSEASRALVAVGAPAEDAVLPLLSDPDTPTAMEAARILERIGTEKCLPTLAVAKGQRGIVASLANSAFSQIVSRNNLKPEQYQHILFDHFVVDGPTGFTEESISTPDTRQWSRTAPGRAVKSVYMVSVKAVPADYTIRPAAGGQPAPTLQTNGLTFTQTQLTSTTALRTVKWAALDGSYLIELSAQVDAFDTTAQTNVQNAVNKIKVRQ